MAKFSVDYKLTLDGSDGVETKQVKKTVEDIKYLFPLIDSEISNGWVLENFTVKKLFEPKPKPVPPPKPETKK